MHRVGDKARAAIIIGKAEMPWGQIHEGQGNDERPNHHHEYDPQGGAALVVAFCLFDARPSTIPISFSVNPYSSCTSASICTCVALV
jgi:hypothetical protein